MNQSTLLSRAFFVVLLLALVAGSATAKDTQIKDVVKKSYDVRPGGTLHLDIDHGNIFIEPGDNDRVLIELERIADADTREEAERVLANHEYAFDNRGNDVFIRSRYDKEKRGLMSRWRNNTRLKINVVVHVPAEYDVDFSSGAGNVEIADLTGRIEGRTGAGNIMIEDVRGYLEIASGAGNIDIEGDIDRAEVTTGAGNINLYGLQGAIEASTGAGNIYAEITRQPRENSELSSGAGNVTVSLARNVGVYVDATAALGSAECEFPSVKVEGKWMKKSFSGEINGGGPELRMHAGVGNVALRRD
ncbi:MAG TPA: DUF4097 family beta strand repeat-containing protein [Rhodothermales bacterium]|nr:DUF4097 family beta strand repeat-containing protein [Rhodothermales bacterium]